MTTPDIAGLCERLRKPLDYALRLYECDVGTTMANAADTLERQAAEIKRLRKAAKAFESAVTTDIPAGPGYAEWVAKAQQARADLQAALTGEDTATLSLSGKTQTREDACTS